MIQIARKLTTECTEKHGKKLRRIVGFAQIVGPINSFQSEFQTVRHCLTAVFAIISLSVFPVLAQRPAVDLILVNAVVRTMDERQPLAEAVAVAGGRIVAVGTTKEVNSLASSSTKVIDARGRLVIPGFNDAHVHFAGVGNWFSHLDANGITTSEDLIKKIDRFATFLPDGRWIIGARLDLSRWKGPRPTVESLDSASPNNPLIIYLTDTSSAIVNSLALRRAGLPAAESSVISGALLTRVQRAIPPDHGSNWAEITEAASNYAASHGVTSVQDVHSDNLLATYQAMAKSGRLKTRIYECVGMSGWKRNPAIAPLAATGDEMVRGGCIKGMSDGSSEEIAELSADVARADRAGHQVMVHAIGRRANENTVNAFAFTVRQNGKRDSRFRIEHAHKIARPEIARLRALGIIASMQPALFYDGSDFGDDYPFLFRSRAAVAFGSDASMIDVDPLMGIHAAVNSVANSVSVETAVRAYTLGSAYAEFQEKQKGSIEVGKLADLVVLSRDIFKIPKTEIKNTKVETTILGGKIVYLTEKSQR